MNMRKIQGLLLLVVLFTVAYPVIAKETRLDVYVVYDVSGSFWRADPDGLRFVLAKTLASKLTMLGPDNRLNIVLFGTAAKNGTTDAQAVALNKMDNTVDRIQQDLVRTNGSCSRAIKALPQAYLKLKSTPISCFTDFYAALRFTKKRIQEAPTQVSDSHGNKYPYKKYVILVTDGKHFPWPGQPRFGHLRSWYLNHMAGIQSPERRYEWTQNRIPKRLDSQMRKIWNNDLNRVYDMATAIAGMDVHLDVVGVCGGNCEKNLDEGFLGALALKGGGRYIRIRNTEDWLKQLGTLFPATSQLIQLKKSFTNCLPGQKKPLKSVSIDIPIEHMDRMMLYLAFKERLNTSLLDVTVQSPGGTRFSWNKDVRNFARHYTLVRKGSKFERVLRILQFIKDKPAAGIWKVQVSYRGANRPCFHGTASAARRQDVEILVNDQKDYNLLTGSDVRLSVRVVLQDNTVVPMGSATCRLGKTALHMELNDDKTMAVTTIKHIQGGNQALTCSVDGPQGLFTIRKSIMLRVEDKSPQCSFDVLKKMVIGTISQVRPLKKMFELRCNETESVVLKARVTDVDFLSKPNLADEAQDALDTMAGWFSVRAIKPRPFNAKNPITKLELTAAIPKYADLAVLPEGLYQARLVFLLANGSEAGDTKFRFKLHINRPTVTPKMIKFRLGPGWKDTDSRSLKISSDMNTKSLVIFSTDNQFFTDPHLGNPAPHGVLAISFEQRKKKKLPDAQAVQGVTKKKELKAGVYNTTVPVYLTLTNSNRKPSVDPGKYYARIEYRGNTIPTGHVTVEVCVPKLLVWGHRIMWWLFTSLFVLSIILMAINLTGRKAKALKINDVDKFLRFKKRQIRMVFWVILFWMVFAVVYYVVVMTGWCI